MSDQYHEYDLLTDHYSDTWLEAGNGMGYTYPAHPAIPPLIRIDYVFHDDAWTGVQARVWHDSARSDHHPVRVTLALTDSDAQ
jgi:endonuclease/exonuclease/phosphatase family metal-dependent hydrolase